MQYSPGQSEPLSQASNTGGKSPEIHGASTSPGPPSSAVHVVGFGGLQTRQSGAAAVHSSWPHIRGCCAPPELVSPELALPEVVVACELSSPSVVVPGVSSGSDAAPLLVGARVSDTGSLSDAEPASLGPTAGPHASASKIGALRAVERASFRAPSTRKCNTHLWRDGPKRHG